MIRSTTALLLILALLASGTTTLAADPEPRDARIAGTFASFEKKYGEPLELIVLENDTDAEPESEADDETTGTEVEISRATYEIEDFADFSITIFEEKLIGISFYAHDPDELDEDVAITEPHDANWDQNKAARFAKRFLPRDVECDDDPIEFNDEERSFACESEDTEEAFDAATLEQLEVIGEQGQISYRLHLDVDGDVYAVDIDLGNGTRAYEGDGTIPEARQPFDPTRIMIPAIGVDAVIENVPITDGVMGIPEDVWAVGWYNQLAQPGDGGNVVMAGHVDWWNVGPVVFYNLSSITEGAMVYTTSADGSGATYVVTSIRSVPWDHPAQEIIARTGTQSITLITCTGDFNGTQYESRLIVRADRI